MSSLIFAHFTLYVCHSVNNYVITINGVWTYSDAVFPSHIHSRRWIFFSFLFTWNTTTLFRAAAVDNMVKETGDRRRIYYSRTAQPFIRCGKLNALNAELHPICHLLALLEAHHILHVGRIRVKQTSVCVRSTRIPYTEWRMKWPTNTSSCVLV